MCKFIAERIITCQCTNENPGNSLTKRDFRLQSGNLVYKMRFSFTKRDSCVTNGTLVLHFTFSIYLTYFYVHIDNFIYFRCHVFAILHKKRTCIPCTLQCIHYTLLYTACLLSYDSDCTERISVECRGYLDTGLLCAGMYYHSVSDIYSAVLYRAVSIEKYVSRLKT